MVVFRLIVEGMWKTPIDPIKAAVFGFHAEMAAFCVESSVNRNFIQIRLDIVM